LLALWAGVMSGCGGGVSSSSANYMGPVPTMANSVAGCPWTPEHRLLRVGLRSKSMR
jgi:hypothetical protein